MKPCRLFSWVAAALGFAVWLPTPGRAAESFIIVDQQTGHIFAESKSNARRPVASLTKIATAMVVLDWAAATETGLSSMATVPHGVTRVGGINPCGLVPGDSVSLRDLLYAALMQSDNRAAYTLAYHVGSKLPNAQHLGPVDNFVAHMNALARTLGMKRTVFLNPHGVDSDSSAVPVSTAADMARLTRYAYNHSGFTFYVAQKTRNIAIRGADGTERAFQLQNTNQLLGQDDIDGVKTGRTARAGDCLILSADRSPEAKQEGSEVRVTLRRVIVVVLASPDRFGEGLSLMRRGWRLYDQWAAQGRPVTGRSTL